MTEPLTYSALREVVARAICHSEEDCSCQSPANCGHYWRQRTHAADAALAAIAGATGGSEVLWGASAALEYAAGCESECGAHEIAAKGRAGAALLRTLAEARNG